MALVLLATTLLLPGCARYYWARAGAGLQDFEQDHQACLRMAIEHPPRDERTYRACLQARGWQREQHFDPPPPGRYRGVEDFDDVVAIAPVLGSGQTPPPSGAAWVAGTWTSGSTTLVLDDRLNWEWKSEYMGQFSGRGRGTLTGDRLLLEGGYSGTTAGSQRISGALRFELRRISDTAMEGTLWAVRGTYPIR